MFRLLICRTWALQCQVFNRFTFFPNILTFRNYVVVVWNNTMNDIDLWCVKLICNLEYAICNLINFGFGRLQKRTKFYFINTRDNFAPNLQHLIYYIKYIWRTGLKGNLFIFIFICFFFSHISKCILKISNNNNKINYIREAAKKGIFLVDMSTKRGWG